MNEICSPGAFVPQDRRRALAHGVALPGRAFGAVLLADLSGYTPLAETLAHELGPQRGADTLTITLNALLGVLIDEIERFGGSVISFGGDAITSWFEAFDTPEQAARRAVACAFAVQHAMAQQPVQIDAAGGTIVLALKVAVALGAVRRCVVGDEARQQFDVLTGHTLDRLAAIEQQAGRGEIVADTATVHALGSSLRVAEWRGAVHSSARAAVVSSLDAAPEPQPPRDLPILPERVAARWVPHTVRERLLLGERMLAELRPATALFLRFGGIDYDAEDAEHILDRWITWIQHVAGQYGGTLIQLVVGDKGSYAYLIFGAPVAHDDDAARAVAAALTLRTPPESFAAPQIGMAHGMTRCGVFGGPTRCVYGAVGDPVNLAARLMQLARPGQVLCDAQVYRQARQRWAFEAGQAVRAKGKAHYVRTYEPSGAPHDRRPAAWPHALVGRRREVARIEQALDALTHGVVLVLEGEAGIGKSRLVAELARLLRERGLTGLLGQGHPAELATPYRPWRDMFAAYFNIHDADDAATRRAAVRNHLLDVLPDAADRLPLLNDLLDLAFEDSELTATLDPQLRSHALGSLLLELLQGWARAQPLVLVLEDAHWYDSLSWDLILRATAWLQANTLPFLVCITIRTLDTHEPALPHVLALLQRPGARHMPLTSLEPDALLALVAERLGVEHRDVPAPVAAAIVERAGGNPFFAEALLDALIGSQALQVGRDTSGRVQCILADGIADHVRALPDSLHSLLLARIDHLAPDAQLTLKVASVVGTTFGFAPVLHVRTTQAPIEPAALHNHLRQLAAERFTLLETPEPALAYRFRHILTQEAAYSMLLFEQRRAFHRATAEWYAQHDEVGSAVLHACEPLRSTRRRMAGSNASLPLIVHHYHEAEESEHERQYAFLAGVQAAQQYANAEALRFLGRALELTPPSALEARYDILGVRIRVYELLGDRARQLDDLDALAQIAAALADTRRQAVAALLRAEWMRATGQLLAAAEAAGQALALADMCADSELQAHANLALGTVLARHNTASDGLAYLERALDLARRHELRSVEADTLRTRGLYHWYQSRYAETVADVQASAAIYRAIGERRGEAEALDYLGNVAAQRGDAVVAAEVYRRSLLLGREVGDRTIEAWALLHLGMVLYDAGDCRGARAMLNEALHLFRAIEGREGAGWAHATLGRLALHETALDAAHAEFVACRDVFHAIGRTRDEGWALGNLGLVALARGAFDEADQHFAAQEQLLAGSKNRHDLLFWHIDVATLALARGQTEAAERHLGQARALSAELGIERAQSHALCGLGAAALQRADVVAARAAFQQALDLVQHLELPIRPAWAHLYLGEAALAEGDLAAARASCEAALALFGAAGSRHGAALADLLAGRCALAQGDSAGALRLCRNAVAALGALGVPDDTAWAYCALGEALLAAGQNQAAIAAWQAALALRQELGQFHLLSRLQAGLALAESGGGDWAAAQPRVEQLANRLGSGAIWPPDSVYVALACFTMFEATHDRRADNLLARAVESLLARAATLEYPARQRFLDNVPEHRAVLAAWKRKDQVHEPSGIPSA